MLRQTIEAQNRIAAQSYFSDTDEFKTRDKQIEKGQKYESMAEIVALVTFLPCGIVAFLRGDWMVLVWVICATCAVIDKRRWRNIANTTRKSLNAVCKLSEAQSELIKHFDTNYTPNFLEKDYRQKPH